MGERLVYKAIFTQTNDEKGTVLVEIPILGVVTEGYGLVDAIEMARDSIGTYSLENSKMPMQNYGEDMVSEFENIGVQFCTYVDIDVQEYRKKYERKSVRRNVTLPNWLNYKAEEAHLNVSKVLQEALMQKLGC